MVRPDPGGDPKQALTNGRLQPAAAEPLIAEEEILRASWYAALARLLAASPSQDMLDIVGALQADDSPFGRAVAGLASAARTTTPSEAEREHFDLFVGLGRGELLPFGSYYLAGFLHEKPLARLRRDMAGLGLARAEGVKEPEDHIASLCDIMAALIAGDRDTAADLATQRSFFTRHVGCWASRFFADLEGAKSARFYRHVGTVGRLFMAVEDEAFELAA